VRVGRLHLSHLAHLAEITCRTTCCLWPSPAPSQRAGAARAAAGEFRVLVGMPPTRASPLAARLLSPGAYIWRPPRSRPIPSLTVPDLHRGIARDHEGERQRSWALSWSTPRGASDHVRRVRLRPRIARRDRSARAPALATPVLRPLCGRHGSGCLRLPVPHLTSFRVQAASVRYLLHSRRACGLQARWIPRL